MKSVLVFFFVAQLLSSYYGIQCLRALEPKNQYDSHIKEKEQNMRRVAVSRVLPTSQIPPDHLEDARQSHAETDQLNDSKTSTECYDCMDCPQVRENTTVRGCPLNHNKCVEYAEVYSNSYDKPAYIRGCVLERGSCDAIKRLHENNDIKLLYCTECVGDRCNGGSRSPPDLLAAFFFIVVTPVVIKCTLS